jgi:hypothetical protein
LKLLEQEKGDALEAVKPLMDEASRDTCVLFNQEKEQAAAAYFIIKDCVETPATHPQNQKELKIGRRYTCFASVGIGQFPMIG